MKKVILIKTLNLKKKNQEALEKNLNCTFIRFNTSKENFDVDYVKKVDSTTVDLFVHKIYRSTVVLLTLYFM